ncbi:hypothetical protein [Succinimonas sp.]|uniref:hypothetical protein n=1 Tax=Succinimonas sp. TaxID=1936151 RepID=UPI00386D958A
MSGNAEKLIICPEISSAGIFSAGVSFAASADLRISFAVAAAAAFFGAVPAFP